MPKNQTQGNETDDSKAKKEHTKAVKDREELARKRIKAEEKRIKGILNFPGKILFNIGMLFGLLAFCIQYYGQSVSLIKSLFAGFLVFSAFYFGIGLILLISVYFVANVRKKEALMLKKQKEEQRFLDDQRRSQELTEEELRLGEQRRQEEMRRFRQEQEQNIRE